MGPLPVAVGDDRSDHRSTAMTTLLLAEHDNKTLKDATQKALTAAKALGQDVHVLVAVKLGGGFGNRATVFAGNQHMHVLPERLGCGQRLLGRILERLVVVFGEEERGHGS